MRTSGLVVVDKPPGMTSHDVVARVRRLARTRRVGHGGTLDPMATGVLVVAVERATRLLTYVIGSDKSYQAVVRLGEATATDDAESEVVARASTVGVTEEQVRVALGGFVGKILQVPSAVSAIKVGGVRAYARARAGERVTLAARPVTISRLDLDECRRITVDDGGEVLEVRVRVACSSGTYIRAIARDLGERLGTGGHLRELRRTAVGGFTLDEAVSLDELAERDDPVTLPLDAAVARFFARRDATPDEARALGHGAPIPSVGLSGPYGVFGPDGSVIAIVSERDGRARPEIVLAPVGG